MQTSRKVEQKLILELWKPLNDKWYPVYFIYNPFKELGLNIICKYLTIHTSFGVELPIDILIGVDGFG